MSPLVKVELPFVQRLIDRHGHERFYFRRRGCKRTTLPHPDTPEFLDAYRAANGEKPAVNPSHIRPIVPGSFGELCETYMRSAGFAQLAEATRREMKYVINDLIAKHGDKRLAKMERHHILEWQDALAAKPGAANKMLRTVKTLLSFAQDRGMRADNLGKGIKLMRTKRWRAWTDDEMARFESCWPLGSRERTGYAMALYSGQRRADLARMKWSDIAGGAIRLIQGKTATKLVIPIQSELSTALAAVHPRHESAILTGDKGQALSPVYFGHLMAAAIDDAGLPKACVLHGLRKTAGRLLAEAGAQVAPITGHRTERMTAEYSRDADQEKMARASVIKWDEMTKRNKG